MTSKFSSLLEKLRDEGYLRSLSHRRRKELEVCESYLSEDELSYFSSIDTAYRIARERYIEDNYGHLPESERDSAKVRYSTPW